ncbi:MAG TPA: ABC transporter ATP-binding protein [Candidatus Acidoferrum sp.]|jgi:ABC-type multidrug transport system fused ATPase/permease subunit|nr:ABC transporter ATP-binding protein [Candidatus Acidoferrum sp.]
MPPFTSGPSGPANLKGDRPTRSSTVGHPNPAKQSFWKLLPHVWELIKPRRGVLLAGFLLMAVNRLCGFALPITPKYLIDDVVTKHHTKLLLPLVLVVLGATLIQALTSYCLAQLLSKSSQRMITELRVKVQEHIGRLPVSYYDANKTGVLVSRIMSDVEGVRNLVGTGLVDFAGGIMTAILALGYLVRVSVSMTAAAAVFLFVFALSLRYAFRTIRPIYRARPKINAEVTGRLTESLGGVRVVKGYHAEEREGQIFQAGVQKLLDNVLQTLNATSLMSASATVLTGIVGATILYLGATKMIAGSLTTGGYFSYNAFLIMLIAPVAQVVSLGPMMTEAMAGLERTREVLIENPEDQDPSRTVKLGRIDGRVTFEGVDFSYETGKQVLYGVSFDSQPGTVSAFVGPSGAGKSTIIGLVAAFYVPSAGRVLVDGADLAHVRLDSYRTQLGVVLQETFLFDGTIRENVAFARPDAKEEEILAACRIARVDEFADHFEKKYETIVGERGVKLSGGQKQRVSIARAILADPRILILDEATSSLDSESEALIQEGLRFLMRGRTTFVIAHRLSTIRRADQILVVEAGKIIERGTHASLYAEKGRYFDLYTRQHGIETNLFLAPGEGDTRPEDFSGANGDSDPDKPAGAALPDAIRMIRERRT